MTTEEFMARTLTLDADDAITVSSVGVHSLHVQNFHFTV
jgi:hypothetical protein